MDELLLTAVATALGSTALHGRALASSLLASPALASPVFASAAPPELPGFLNSLAPVLHHYGVWAIVLLVFLEDFGIPVPGETVLIAGAVFAGSGQLNIVMVGVAGFIAAIAGDNVGYAIGRFGGRALVDRWGKYVFLTPERMDKAEDFFNRHGGKIIAIARFVEGLRQANGIIAGIIEMHWLKFVAFNALGAALWVGTWVSVGYFAGQHITAIYDAITRYSLYAAIAAAVVIVAWIGLRVRKRRQRLAATRTQATTGGALANETAAQAPGPEIVAEATVAEGSGTDAPAEDAGLRATAEDEPGDAGGGSAGMGPQDSSARS
ncbi:MAG TPA: DedA family protein [Trebonia sp.]|nr:DedA family protein [Trebonia sp.]